MDFNSMMFNNNYVNQAYYQQQQEQILRYQFAQDEEVRKAVHAIKDLCNAVKKMDDEHQQQAFWACLAAMANEYGWQAHR